MKKEALIDSGPLVALFNASDRWHKKTLTFLKNYQGTLITTWPVITEVVYLLRFSVHAQTDFLEFISRGGLRIAEISTPDLRYITNRMEQYKDRPMDLADASLMCIAERESIDSILSIDSDFSIYRTSGKKQLKNLMQPAK